MRNLMALGRPSLYGFSIFLVIGSGILRAAAQETEPSGFVALPVGVSCTIDGDAVVVICDGLVPDRSTIRDFRSH
jgi:hypothetical protein